MKILHTSDWHLGHTLFGQKRYGEFQLFLDWLKQLINDEEIDVLLVAGDIFDSSLPPNQAQTLYYRFLNEVAQPQCPCKHIVITAGNHDSPSFLDAPRTLLSALDIHVAGRAQLPEQEVLSLKDVHGQPELIVCAVPFLRDRDLYNAETGDTFEERDQKLLEGLKTHYQRCASEAERQRGNHDIPVIAMGHMFVSGGRVLEDDGVRDLRVGSLGQVDASIFPSTFDYTALGHLHIPQKAGGSAYIRYSGSPIPMGFGEADQKKQAVILETSGREITVRTVDVPRFQRLEKISGDRATIENRLTELALSPESVWVEIVCTSDELLSDLKERILKRCGDNVSILRIRMARQNLHMLEADPEQDMLEDMDVLHVFQKKLQEHFPETPLEESPCAPLLLTFEEALRSFQQEEESCAS